MNNPNENSKYSWTPTLKWFSVSLAIIYVVVILLFFLFNFLLKDYMRDIPKELTPWLNNEQTVETNK